MDRKRELAAAEDVGWGEFLTLVEALDTEQTLEPGYQGGERPWSVKDLVAHVGCWLAEAGLLLERMAVGTYTDDPVDVDAMNDRFYDETHDLPLPVVRAECFSARTRMLVAWRDLPEVTPDAEEWFVESGARHYAAHVEGLREWAGELSSRSLG